MATLADGGRRWWALAAVNLAVLACGLDGTVTSVALPTLARSLRASEADLQWFSSAYLLALAAAMLPSGLLGDRYGRKKVLLGALTLFGAGSAACAGASSPGEFIAARLLLGVAGAGVVVMAVSALTGLFQGEERQKAIGIWAAVNFVALPIGPILGGWLLSRYWWGWVFLAGSYTAGVALQALAILAMFGVFFVLPQYFQGVFGTDAIGAGVRLLPLIGGLTIGALPAQNLTKTYGFRLPACAGFLVLAAGLALGARTAASNGDAFAGTWTAVAGAGTGLALATAASAALAEVSEAQASMGSALMQALNKIGAPLGSAVLGSVLNRGYVARVDVSRLPPPAAAVVRRGLFSGVDVAERTRSLPLLASVRSSFVHGMNGALLVSAAVAVVAAALAAILLPARREAGERSGDFAGARDALRP